HLRDAGGLDDLRLSPHVAERRAAIPLSRLSLGAGPLSHPARPGAGKHVRRTAIRGLRGRLLYRPGRGNLSLVPAAAPRPTPRRPARSDTAFRSDLRTTVTRT